MTLSAGTRLGPYEILAPLGAGGMGEVYRAADTKLGREVAIKVLPSEVAWDPERLARFEREARLLASLNHPNIAQVYGFESTTLPDGSTGHFLAMELVEGEDLAERLKRGAIPVDETIELARQVAEALEEAHEKGIVHRDLKPANTKVTPDGKVKVLDFGLAKAWAGDGAVRASVEDRSQSPTLARTGTQVGVILGTAGYMSPEQARGRPVDRRADIWAFGVVLYEMLSGRRLFEGETVTDVLASVVKDPIDWGVLPEDVPAPLRSLLERCLERDPRKRLRDIGDARIELEGAPHAPVAVVGPGAPGGWISGRTVAAATATLLIGLVAGGVAMRGTRPGPSSPSGKAWHFTVDVGPGQYLNEAFDPPIALSPDGTMLAYSVYGGFLSQELRLRRMDGLEAHPLPGTRRSANPFFSPDGQWLAYFTFPDDRLVKVPVEGGKPVDLCAAPIYWGGTWDVHDDIFFGSLGSIHRVSARGGKPEVVLAGGTAPGKPGYRYPEALPGGDALLLTTSTEGDDYTNASIVLLDLATHEVRPLVDRGADARYVPTGHLVFVRDGALLAVPFDLERRQIRGTPVPVVPAIDHIASFAGGRYSFSKSGVLAYVPPGPRLPTARVVWRRRDGSTEPLGLSVPHLVALRLSPDGNRLAMSSGTGNPRLSVFDLRRAVLAPLTAQPAVSNLELQPVWTPDGQRIAFSTGNDASYVFQLHWTRADGSGPTELLRKSDVNAYPYDWTSDGRTLVFVEETADRGANIGILSPGNKGEAHMLLSSAANEDEPALSPDDRWLAYTSDESGRREVFVRPFPGMGARWKISTEAGFSPRWSRSGRDIFYRDGHDLMAVAVDGSQGFTAGRPRALFRDTIPPWLNGGYDVSPDGQRFVTMEIEEDGAKRIVMLLDWFEELKRLAPTGR
jgi:serine/threonine protein kinase/Tol biopolymer transport system component